MKQRSANYMIALYLGQVILSLTGTLIFQIRVNPIVLLVISAAFPVYYLKTMTEPEAESVVLSRPARPWLVAALAMLPSLLAYEELRKMWVRWSDPGRVSDVIPQLQAQSDWFFSGQFPYQWVRFESYQAFPVYMPLHWMPARFSRLLQLDVRWVGFLLLLGAMGLAAYCIAKSARITVSTRNYFALILWSVPLWSFIVWNPLEMAVSLETIVAAWYLVLAAGLLAKNHWLIGIGLAGCLLSRYTGVFWAPTFAYLLWRYQPKKYSFYLWGGVAAAVLGLYIVPFLMKEPGILEQGVLYHNMCALGGWTRPDQYTYEHGLTMAIHLREWLPGVPEHSLFLARALQGAIMLLLSAGSIWLYVKKWHQRTDIYAFSLASLQLALMLFYIFSPMVFQYYMLVPLVLGGVMCWYALSASDSGKAAAI